LGDWPRVTLSEAPLAIIDGDRGENYPHQEEFSPVGDCLFLNAGNVTSAGFSFSNCAFISKEKDASLRKGKLIRSDIVLTTRGTVGNVAFFNSVVPYDNIRINSGMVILRAQSKTLDPQYLYLFVRSALFRQQVSALETGSAQPQLPIKDINRIAIPIPPLAEQKAIASVIGALDDKTALDNRMNETLEGMAQAIFKDWFVDFGPTLAKMEGRAPYLPSEIWSLFPDRLDNEGKPKGYREEGLLNYVHLLSGGTPKTGITDYWGGNIAWASAKDVSQSEHYFLLKTKRSITQRGLTESATRIIPKFSTVVVARGATTGRACMFGVAMAMNQTCYALVPKAGRYFFLNCLFKNIVAKLVHAAHGSVFDTITTKTFQPARVIMASEQLQDCFENLGAPMFHRILSNVVESDTLASTRDLLLPKLMSGEIRVKDAEKVVEDAL
jgi:type I restriction enzyme, S subunit